MEAPLLFSNHRTTAETEEFVTPTDINPRMYV
jgi:hypothetical protein